MLKEIPLFIVLFFQTALWVFLPSVLVSFSDPHNKCLTTGTPEVFSGSLSLLLQQETPATA